MSFIHFATTKVLTLNQELALKKCAETLVMNVFDENCYHLMIHIEDNQVMYYQGKAEDCMAIHCQINIKVNANQIELFKEKLCQEVESITHIPLSRQYTIIEEK